MKIKNFKVSLGEIIYELEQLWNSQVKVKLSYQEFCVPKLNLHGKVPLSPIYSQKYYRQMIKEVIENHLLKRKKEYIG